MPAQAFTQTDALPRTASTGWRDPDGLAAMLAGVDQLSLCGPIALPSLARCLRRLIEQEPMRTHEDDTAAWDNACQRLQQHVVRALATATRASPWSLAALYDVAGPLLLRDTICEAAGKRAAHGRATPLLQLQLKHLAINPAVAALSLAEYGDRASIPHIQRALQRCSVVGPASSLTDVAALREALSAFGLPDAAAHLALPPQRQLVEKTRQLRRLANLSCRLN